MLIGVLLLVLGFVVTGLVLIIKSRRRGPSYPSCGKCGYDVTGTLGTAVRCPECGSTFAEAGILPAGRRTNRPLLAAGIATLVVGVGCLGTGVLSTTYAMRSAVTAQQQAIAARQQAIMAQQQLVQAELEAQQADAEAEVAEDEVEAIESPAEIAPERRPQ